MPKDSFADSQPPAETEDISTLDDTEIVSTTELYVSADTPTEETTPDTPTTTVSDLNTAETAIGEDQHDVLFRSQQFILQNGNPA